MLLGEYKHSVTKGNRLALPSKIRNELKGEDVILARGFESCILGYEKEVWQKMAEVELAKPVTELEARKTRRQLFPGALLTEIDQQGRIVIPKALLDHASIKEKVTVVGVGDHFEIWEEGSWENYLKTIGE